MNIHRTLVVGLGSIGMKYDLQFNNHRVTTHTKSTSTHKNFTLIGAVDLDEEKRSIFKKIYNCPVFSNVTDAVEELRPDIVIVATPTSTHFDIIKQIISNPNKMLKAILCEKPVTDFSEKTKEILNCCRERNIKLFVNFTRRGDPSVKYIKQSIISEKFKLPFKGSCWYSKGLMHNGVHFLVLMSFFFGQISNIHIITESKGTKDYDYQPDIKVQFKKGVIYFFAVDEKNFSYYDFKILFKNGELTYDNKAEVHWRDVINHNKLEDYRTLNSSVKEINNEMEVYQYNIMNELDLALNSLESSLATGEDFYSIQLATQKIIEGKLRD